MCVNVREIESNLMSSEFLIEHYAGSKSFFKSTVTYSCFWQVIHAHNYVFLYEYIPQP